jgi:nucleotide-binding universal stress UspA family protein
MTILDLSQVQHLHLDNNMTEGDLVTFNELLAEIWPETNQPIRVLVYHQAGSTGEVVCDYARYITSLLRGQLDHFQASVAGEADFCKLINEVKKGYDLVIFEEPHPAPFKRLFCAPVGCKAVKQLPISVLVARRPRQRLSRILFLTREQRLDEVALDWLIPLAQASLAAVTVLVVLPRGPVSYSRSLGCYGLTYWLATNTPLGGQLRQISQQLMNWEARLKLQFRSGLPNEQIEREVEEGDPDLIIMAADATNWWQRRIPGVLVEPLLQWIDRPVLVTKPVDVYVRN